MLKTKHLGYQTFNDGWGTSFGILNRRLTAPKQVYIHFQEASVGERRFWDAQISGITVVRAVRVPIDSKVNQGDVFEIDGVQYEVAQKRLDRIQEGGINEQQDRHGEPRV